jgi:NAD(P)-dependent dehydrogenase (short-subunit alcohol dehydrogenase family)
LGITTTLRKHGASVVLVDRDEAALEEAVAEIGGDEPTVGTFVADVSDSQDVDSLFETVVRDHGRLDILVNNAGILLSKDFVDHTDEDWDRVLAVNLRSVFLTCKRALVPMIEAGKGSIVNISSIAAFDYTTNHVAYAVSKAGVSTLTRDLAWEVGPLGVRVNAIAPGPIETPMTLKDMGEELRQAMGSTMRVGRWGKPEDIGEAISFLCSDAAGYVTGITMNVAGGAGLSTGSP